MLKLEYPYTSPTLSVELPNPVLGDGRTTPLQMVMKKSMNGTVYSYKSTNTRETLLLSFKAICDWDDAITFINGSLNADTKLTFNHGEAGAIVWRGRITSVPVLLSQDSATSHSLTFEFQGIKQ